MVVAARLRLALPILAALAVGVLEMAQRRGREQKT
jgi:hypothetical protein